MIITAYNPPTDNLEKSNLSSSLPSGTTTFKVRNNDRFKNNAKVLIGELGAENSEIVTIGASGVNSDGITLTLAAGTKLPHTANDPIYMLRYNQVKFYRSTTTIDGSYDIAGTVDMDVDNAEQQTRYNDPTGLSSYFYKISYFNSVDNVESELSNPISGQGYNKKQLGTLANEFLTDVGDLAQEYITIPQIISLCNEVNEDIISQSRKPYRFLKKSAAADITAGENYIDLPEDLFKFDRVTYTRTDGVNITKGNLDIISLEEFEYREFDQSYAYVPTDAFIGYAAIDDENRRLLVSPKPTLTQAGSLLFRYYGDFDEFTSLSDVVQTPNKRIYKLFLLGRYYRMRAKKDAGFLSLADRYTSDYNTEIVKLQRDQKIDVGSKMSFLPDSRRSGHGLRR